MSNRINSVTAPVLHWGVRVPVLVRVFLLTVMFGVTPVRAASISVSTTNMAVANDGECTLIEAIIAANTDTASGDQPGECPAGSGADTILLVGTTYRLTEVHNDEEGPAGLPLVTTEITIEGNGATIERDGSAPEFRIFTVEGDTSLLRLNNMTVRGGRTSGEATGAGLLVRSDGIAELNNVHLVGNITDHGGSQYLVDGSIKVGPGKLILTNSSVSDNTGEHANGVLLSGAEAFFTHSTISGHTEAGIRAYYSTLVIQGGAIRDNGRTGVEAFVSTLTITGATISGNRDGGMDLGSSVLVMSHGNVISNTVNSPYGNAAAGLAIRASSVATLTHTTVAGNDDYSYPCPPSCVVSDDGVKVLDASLTIRDSLIADDLSADDLDNTLTFYGAVLTIGNSTISGAARTHVYLGEADRVEISDSTIISDYPGEAGALDNAGLLAAGTVHITNSIIEGCWYKEPNVSHGYNLEPEATCGFTSTGDVQNVDFENLVGPLQDNGGPTYTRALLPGSLAIDAIPIGVNGCEAGLSTDQRGAPRAGGADQGGNACDIGAYEAASAAPVTHFLIYLPVVWR